MQDQKSSMIILDSQEFHKVIKNAIESTLVSIKENASLSTSTPNDLLSTEQLAQKLQVSDQTINRWRKKNRIPFVKIGKSFRFDLEQVLQVLTTKNGGK